MTHNQKNGLKLLIAAFVFGAAMGYIGALWQITTQQERRIEECLAESQNTSTRRESASPANTGPERGARSIGGNGKQSTPAPEP